MILTNMLSGVSLGTTAFDPFGKRELTMLWSLEVRKIIYVNVRISGRPNNYIIFLFGFNLSPKSKKKNERFDP